MRDLVSLTYVSSATELIDGAGLLEMMARWRPKNHALGLTGMLLYSGGNIIQVLEGPGAAVETTFELICADPRHHDVLELLREPISERAFPDWSMGFREISRLELQDAEGFNPFLQQPPVQDPDLPAASAHRLLALFRRSMR